MVNLKPRYREFCKIYEAIVNAIRLDRRHCKIYEAVVNVRPLYGFCEIMTQWLM